MAVTASTPDPTEDTTPAATAEIPAASPARNQVPDELLLTGLRQRITERRLGVRAIHVHREGRREVSHRFVDDTIENLYSVSKTVTALAVGIAAQEGLLAVEDRVLDHLPAPSGGAGAGWDGVRIHHLLTMTSGSPITVFLDEQREHPDLTALILGTDLAREPGEAFEYSNGSIYLLSRIIHEHVGQSMRDWLMPRLFEPLGILNPQWFTDRCGITWGATGLNLKSGQIARIGRLLLDRGSWEGCELVPGTWVDRMHADDTWVSTGDLVEPESARYGYGVWDCSIDGAWRADGAYGQMLLVLPEQRAMVALTSHLEGRPGADIIRAVWEELLPLL